MPRILGILRDNNRKTIVSTELIINSKASEVAIALLEDGRLVEYQTQDARNDFAVGDIYIGKVRKVIPGLNSAFVDIGHEKRRFFCIITTWDLRSGLCSNILGTYSPGIRKTPC